MSEPYRERLELDEDGDGDGVVTVGTFQTTVEAEMSREYLKAHGVDAHSHDTASFNPLMNVAAGGARLLVAKRDEARARFFLDRAARTPTTTAEDDAEEGDVRCPRCEQTYCFQESMASHEAHQAAMASPLLALLMMPFRLRKKRWHCHKCQYVWDDAEEGPKRATPLGPDDPRPVFRLRRHRGGTGLFVGLVLMMGITVLLAGLFKSSGLGFLGFPLGIVAAFLAYRAGRRTITDVCSAPHCRAVLPPGEEECPSCHGFVAGVIRFAHEHYSESAAFRRELRDIEAEKAEKAKKKKALPKKGKSKKREALPAKGE